MAAAKGRTEVSRELEPRRGRLGLAGSRAQRLFGKRVGSRKSQG